MSNKYYQQGDVLVKESGIPPGAKRTTPVLVVSVATGHTHFVEGPAAVLELDGVKYIDAAESFKLKHPEHNELVVPPGQYRVEIVREYDHFAEEARSVVD